MNLATYVKRKYKIKDSEGIYENGMVKFNGKSFRFNQLVKKYQIDSYFDEEKD